MVSHKKSPKKSKSSQKKSPKKSKSSHKKSPKKSKSSHKKSPKKTKVLRKKDMIGSKTQVWDGTKQFTAGGLTKKDLMKNRKGKVVSRAMSERAKKNDNLGDYRIPAKTGKRSRSPSSHKKSPKKHKK